MSTELSIKATALSQKVANDINLGESVEKYRYEMDNLVDELITEGNVLHRTGNYSAATASYTDAWKLNDVYIQVTGHVQGSAGYKRHAITRALLIFCKIGRTAPANYGDQLEELLNTRQGS